ncbi:hypothetical protein DRO42_02345 [Candidatus Bathyarchaeota archaeon]|nr:MAG: hypothetical protein DRO42_02345 [Candidatus Bathyarchaeota archaeon]
MVKVYKVDPNDPDYCDDSMYRPEDWEEFLQRQEDHRREVMTYINEADEKGWIEELNAYGFILALRLQDYRDFYRYKDQMPKWQARECKYMIIMYSEIVDHVKEVLRKRRQGL